MAALGPFAVLAYFAPVLIAFERRHRFLWTIAVLNVVTGWTLLGWIAALIWAVNKDVRGLVEELPVAAPESPLEPQWNPEAPAEPLSSGDFKHCPFCAEAIRAEAIVCRYCSRDVPGERVKPATDLDQQEKRRLQTLLADGVEERPDRGLLDVFEYARLLEAEESSAVLTLVAGSNPGQALADTRGEERSSARLSLPEGNWDKATPDAGRVAARR